MKKINLAYIFIFLNLVLAAGQLFLTSLRAEGGSALSDLQIQAEKLQGDNQRLSSELYAKSSLSYIQSQAQSQNLIHLQPQFVSPALPIAVVSVIEP